MTARLAPLLALLAGSALAQQACTLPFSPPPVKTRVVFLLDTSGSMAGKGDSVANIFSAVKGAMVRGMRATTAPGSVELQTFDRGPQQRSSFLWPQERAEFDKTVNTLQANGANTWLYRSMVSIFNVLTRRDDVATTVYVVTDGIDNDPAKVASIDSALSAFNQVRGPFDKLYYVALGTRVPENVKARFRETSFAQAIELPAHAAPDFNAVTLTPALLTVGPQGSFPYRHPDGTRLQLDSDQIGGASVGIKNPTGRGEAVNLKIQGTVAAGSVGYMCAQLPGSSQTVILRFDQDTPRRPGEKPTPGVPETMLGTLRLLNPDLERRLRRGQRAVLHYKAVGGPVTAQVQTVPPELKASLPDQTVSLLEGETTDLTVTNLSLPGGELRAPSLRLNDRTPMKVPPFTGLIVRPFPWWWLLLGLLLLLALLFLISWARRRLDPWALSVDRSLRVYLHDRRGKRLSAFLRPRQTDIGRLFRVPRLRGLVIERYRPEITDENEVVLDTSDMTSVKEYTAQRNRRAARLQAQPDTLRLHKLVQDEGVFLELGETLALRQLYVFTDYAPPPTRRPRPQAPPEPPIEVIVTLLDGAQGRDLELPLDDVDLADVFGTEGVRGLVVRREPGLLRLRALDGAMRLRHISREFRPGEALPLAVMLDLTTASGPYQVRVRDKASLERYKR